MSRLNQYLHQALKGTYLRRREKQAWIEEMQCHLTESAQGYVEAGLTEDEACERAIVSFGTVREIRRQVIRETFIISPRWFLLAAFLCLMALVVALYTNMRFNDVIIKPGGPTAWINLPNPPVVVWLHRYFPLNPNRWAALGTMCLMMMFTRTKRDRVAVLASAVPFCILEVLLLVHPIQWLGARYFFFSEWPPTAPLGIVSLSGCLLFFVLSISLYVWTRNRAVSITPWAITISLTAWPFMRDAVQSALWGWTHNPIFWGHSSPWGPTAWSTLLSVILRIIMVMLFLLIVRWIESIPIRRMTEV